jgi:hypothetical protein
MLAGFILRHGFDHGVRQAFAAEIMQRVFNEPAAQTLTAELHRDGQVRNPALAALVIHSRRDIANEPALNFGHEHSARVCSNIFINVTRFAPAPVAPAQDAQRSLDILFERDTTKRIDGQLFYPD